MLDLNSLEYLAFIDSLFLPHKLTQILQRGATSILTQGATGIISGTPTSASYVNLTLTVTDSSYATQQSVTQSLSIRTTSQMTITSGSVLPTARVGSVMNPVTLTVAGGTSPFTWSIIGGTLPPGLNFNVSTNTLTGTPTLAGDFIFTIRLVDSVGNTTGTASNPDKQFFMHVSAPLSITTNTVPTGGVGIPYVATLAATGGQQSYTWSIVTGTLPAGLTLSSTTGVVSGTPTTKITSSNVTFGVVDSDNPAQSSQKVVTFNVNDGLTINETNLPIGRGDQAYTTSIHAWLGTTPYTWRVSSGELPNGLTLSQNAGIATVSGTPITAGLYTFALEVVDSSSTPQVVTQSYTFNVYNPIEISTATLPGAVRTLSYSAIITTTGGLTPYSYSIVSGSLPQGLAVNPATGDIFGTPPAITSQSSTFTVLVTDSGSPSASVSKQFTIMAIDPLVINTSVIPGALQESSYGPVTLDGTGGIAPLSWSLANSTTLPNGLALSSVGVISGTAAGCGTFNFTVQLADNATVATTVQKAMQLTVTCTNDYVLSGNAGVAGATVNLSGTATRTATADASGNYSFSPLAGGSYTITPSKATYLFSPAERTITVNNADTAVAAFTAALDTTPPTVTVFTVPASSTSLTVAVSALTSTDNAGVTGYLLTESATTPAANAAGWSATKPVSYSFTGIPDGIATTKTLYAWSKDAAGNVSSSTSATTTITLPDVTKPVITTFTLPASNTSLTVTVSALITTDNVAATGYLLTETATIPVANATGWSATKPVSYSFTGIPDGIATTKTLYAWTKDAAGNVSNSSSATTTITLPDVTKPVIATFTLPASNTSLTVTVSALITTDNVAATGYLLTESATAPAANATGWSATQPTNYTFAGIPDGIATTKTLYAWSKDAAGNVSSSSSATTTITLPDVTNPVVTTFTLPASGTSLTVTVSALITTDNVAATGYLLTETATIPVANATGWSATKPVSYSFTGIPDGIATAKTLYAWTKDAAGNVSSSSSATTTITLPDVTKPVVTTFTLPASGTSLTVAVSALITTDNVAATGYLLTESATAPAANAAGWIATQPVNYTFSNIPDGIATPKTLYAWTKDAAGNVSNSSSATTTITLPDVTKPVITTFTLPASGTSLTVAVSALTTTDNVAAISYLLTESAIAPAANATGWSTNKPTNFTFIGIPDGIATVKTLYAWTKDAAGNVSNSSSATTTITLPDVTKPVVTAFIIPATGTDTSVPVTTLTATDNVAITGYLLTESSTAPAANATGWSATKPTNYTFIGIPDGIATAKTLYAWTKDAAGNVSASLNATMTIDAIGPELVISTLADGAVTNNATLNISGTIADSSEIGSLSVNDATVTITNGNFSYPVTLIEGDNIIAIIAIDVLGNSTTETRTVTLDQNAPALTVTTPVDNSATATVQAIINGSCGDAASVTVKVNDQTPQTAVITSDSYTLTINLSEGQNTVTITATDAVGNSTSAARTVVYDVTAPTLAITLPAEDVTVYSMPYTISGTVEDALTDVSLTVTVNSQAVTPIINAANFTYHLNAPQGGTYQVLVTAKDQLENTSTVIRNVIYKPYADLDNDGATTSADALLALQMAIGKKTLDMKADLAPLINGVPAPDGKVTAADALVILRKAVGLW